VSNSHSSTSICHHHYPFLSTLCYNTNLLLSLRVLLTNAIIFDNIKSIIVQLAIIFQALPSQTQPLWTAISSLFITGHNAGGRNFLQNYGGHLCVATTQRTTILRSVLSKLFTEHLSRWTYWHSACCVIPVFCEQAFWAMQKL